METIGEIIEAENSNDDRTENDDPKNMIIRKKLEANRNYKKYIQMNEYDKSMFFMVRMTAFEECLDIILGGGKE